MKKRIEILFHKYLNNACTRDEFNELFDYINMHRSDFTEDMISKLYEKQLLPAKRRRVWIPAAAATLLAGMITLAWFNSEPKPATLAADIVPIVKQTAKSEYRYVLLPDSTQVWLNAASTLEFPAVFAATERSVTLTGEAYFDVKHADRVPFIIHTGKVSTVVVGTAFNIKAYPGQEKITVSVKRGKVKVNYSDKQVASLVKGEQVSIRTDETAEAKLKMVKAEETAAWQEGKMNFDDETISDIAVYLEKIYDVRIVVEKQELKNLHITTGFKRESGIGKVLEVLSRLTDCELNLRNGTYILK